MRSDFRTILTMCVLMVIGLSLLPFIDVSNEPREEQGKTLYIQFSWDGASAKVIEQNATSKIEGLMAAVEGVEKVSSMSYFGRGEVKVELRKDVNVSAVKFEISSLLKNVYKKLPQNVSYPILSGGEVVRRGGQDQTAHRILEYQINAEGSNEQIKEWLTRQVKPLVERVDGVHDVEITGGGGQYIEIEFDQQKAMQTGITMNDIADAIRNYLGKENFVSDVVASDALGNKSRLGLYIYTGYYDGDLSAIPVRSVGRSMIYLNDLSTLVYKGRLPDSYYRVNGLNTIYMNVNADADANTLRTTGRVTELINGLSVHDFHFTLNRNLAKEKMKDLRELAWQSALSFIILLVFVWLTKRDLKYLVIISSTLIANILCAVIVYWLFDIRMHPYSLAGVTVSLGLVIDASIVMVDHYSYYHNRKMFFAILVALLTTVGALVVIFFLPDDVRHDLRDFTWVVIINLTLTLLVAYLFVPSLVDTLHYNSRTLMVTRHRKLMIWWNRFYLWYLSGINRFKKTAVAVCIVLVGGLLYLSIQLFMNSSKAHRASGDNKETVLHVRAQMPLGGTAAQLNEKIVMLEQFISGYREIKRFETRVSGWGATVDIEFTDSANRTSFPYILERKVIGKIITIGDADWSTYGVSERGFSNSLNLQYRANGIEIAGYDYDQLCRYAEDIMDTLAKNRRVVDAVIETPGYERQEDELYVRYDNQRMALYSVNIQRVHNILRGLLSEQTIGEMEDHSRRLDVVVKSAQRNKFDLWQLQNSYIKVDTIDVRLSNFVTIARREAKNCIPKENQEYVLRVSFNVLGSYTYTDKLLTQIRKDLNGRFPVGFQCKTPTFSWYENEETQYWLIGIVIVIIYMLCAVLFESFHIPLVIISNIPVSLIGTFLTFYFAGIEFGSGGLAAIVLLCGVAVNSAIYIIVHLKNSNDGRPLSSQTYLKAYNHKIVPVFLTTLSSIVGLVPFLINSDSSQFWYSFALGAMGGLFASFFSLVFVMPVFLRK